MTPEPSGRPPVNLDYVDVGYVKCRRWVLQERIEIRQQRRAIRQFESRQVHTQHLGDLEQRRRPLVVLRDAAPSLFTNHHSGVREPMLDPADDEARFARRQHVLYPIGSVRPVHQDECVAVIGWPRLQRRAVLGLGDPPFVNQYRPVSASQLPSVEDVLVDVAHEVRHWHGRHPRRRELGFS